MCRCCGGAHGSCDRGSRTPAGGAARPGRSERPARSGGAGERRPRGSRPAPGGDRGGVPRREVHEECYRAGARHVEVDYVDPYLQRSRVLHGGDDAIGFAPPWEFDRVGAVAEAGCAQIGLSGGTDPSVLAGLDPDRLGRDRSPVGREWMKAVAERALNWTVGPAPSARWAAVVHPEMEPEAAL